MNSQHIDQQNELIKSLQERIQHIEGANTDGEEGTVSTKREVRNFEDTGISDPYEQD